MIDVLSLFLRWPRTLLNTSIAVELTIADTCAADGTNNRDFTLSQARIMARVVVEKKTDVHITDENGRTKFR